jgi:DNA-binding CsgD family transcriptional regulator/tetratricopeptide (TPR) repeat protein
MRHVSLIGDAQTHVDGLVERERELAALEAALAEVSAGHGRVMLVTAEAGGGKTALIDRFCADLAGSTRVLRGACDALFTPRPLGPIHDFAADVGPGLRDTLLGEAIPYEVAASLIDELRRRKPTVLVVEDIHWADEATLDVLRLVARRIAAERVLIVVSYRDEALDAGHPVRVMLGELATGRTFTRMPLVPLSPEAVAQIADSYDVEPSDLHRVTAGNPFFVTEVLASGSSAIPATVRDAVLARAARLSREARAVLDAVAIAPPHVELWLLDALADDHGDTLEECLSSGMLVQHAAGGISFRHELARLAIEESLEPRRRLTLHRAALVALSNPRLGPPDVARLAHHADASGDADAVLRYAPAAAERATAVGAHREAAAHYARVLRFGARLSAAERAGLLERRSRACYLTDDIDEAIAAVEEALELRRALAQRLEEGESLTWLSHILYCPGRMAESTQAARQAVELLETLPPSSQLASAYLRTDWALAERALALAEEFGDAELVLRIRTALARRDFTKSGSSPLEECLGLARAAGMADLAGTASDFLVTGALEMRRYDLAAQYVDSGLAYCSEHGLELARFYHLGWRARIELDQGRWDEAAEAAAAVLRIRRASIMPRITGLVVLGLVRARRGDPGHRELHDEAWSLAEPTDDLFRMGRVVAARAEVAWLAGDRDAVGAITDYSLGLALERTDRNVIGELGVWRRRAGIDEDLSGAPEPHAAELAGDWAQAAALWSDAGCRYEAALALAGADEEEPLRQALAGLQLLGARPAASIVARKLRELGVRGVTRGPRPSTSANTAALTARELEVLRLLADGLRNTAIGERLFLSRRTVEHHVSAILAKLGAQSRGEAVAEAGRLGLLGNP